MKVWMVLILGVMLMQTTTDLNAGPKVRILSYNIHHGEGTDGKFDYERLAKAIKSVNPDLVALQEVDNKTQRASGVDQAKKLGELTGMHHVFGKAMDFSGGGYGEAILSKYEFMETRNHPLSASPGNEPRTAIEAKIKSDEGLTIRFVGTHLDHLRNPKDRITQAKELNEKFEKEKGSPIILVGDLNARPGSEPMKLFLKEWGDAFEKNPQPTIPSKNPKSQIDWILFRPQDQWKVIEARVLKDYPLESDHCPVMAVLEFTGEIKK